MKVEWRCASMTSGGQCVMTVGAALMPLWSASNWDMQQLEVSANVVQCEGGFLLNLVLIWYR